ncbi:MAG: glycosyltransferase family 2 protein [Thermoanaerobaculales bacterium]|jgi:GT2 family glycosyltransferase|nr:glycosyltransferase family 2 protein [Thermoanaerobaculales bacterium]
MISTSAVVVRWKGGDEVDRCLRSLLAQTGGDLTRIVLVDSGSGDGGAERLAAAFPDVTVLALEENRSFAHAANTGAAATRDENLLLLNPDTELDAGVVSALVDTAQRHPGAAGAVPVLTDLDGSSQHRWQLRRLPTTWRLATGRPGVPAFDSPPRSEVPVEQPAAAAWLVRHEVWDALGGLDEGFAPAWWEDVDFCARMARECGRPGFPADRGLVVDPSATVRHLGGSSLDELEPSFFRNVYTANLLRYAARHHAHRLSFIRTGNRLFSLLRTALRRTGVRPDFTPGRRTRS